MRLCLTGCYSNNVSIAVVLAFVLLTQAGCKWLDRVTYESPDEQCLKNKEPGTEMEQFRCLAERVRLDSVRYENAYEGIRSSRKEGNYDQQYVDWAAEVLRQSAKCLEDWYANERGLLSGIKDHQVQATDDIIAAAKEMVKRIEISTGTSDIDTKGTQSIAISRDQIDAALVQLKDQ